MSDVKPVYLLAGRRQRGARGPDPVVRAVLRECGKSSPTIAYTGTANGDDAGFFSRMAGGFREAGAGKVSHALIAPEEADLKKARDILESADIVFVSGGDVDGGMRVLGEKDMTGFLAELHRQGKPFFGSSAGAIMLAKEWVRWPDPEDSSSAELFPCLGFAPVICDCHDEEGGWEELKAALGLKEDNVKGYGIPSGAAIRVSPDGVVEALGGAVYRYVQMSGKTERLPDILPAGS
jgi:peptidase E